jgi:hypothetical protein
MRTRFSTILVGTALAIVAFGVIVGAAGCTNTGSDPASIPTEEFEVRPVAEDTPTTAQEPVEDLATPEARPVVEDSPDVTEVAPDVEAPDGAEVTPDETACDTPTVFRFPPVDLDKTAVVVPLGLMSGNHVTPVDHQYFQDFDNDEVDIEVYAPGDGVITGLQHMFGSYLSGPDSELIEWADFRLVIDHGCGLESIYIHIDRLSDRVAAQAPEKGDYSPVSISVKAGEIIGWYSQNVDYNLVDQAVVLSGFLVPEHYASEPWKIHVPHTLDYFTDEVRDQIAAKSLRTSEPIGGKFDHDIDGRLIGNWFQEGTNGYAGLEQSSYWVGHLSVSPNYLDPSHFIVSIGDFDGEPRQFGVRGNSPFPSDVTTESGLIRYELVRIEYYDGDQYWDRRSLASDLRAESSGEVLGVILLQLVEGRRLRVEVFPGMASEQIDGFTENARFYER